MGHLDLYEDGVNPLGMRMMLIPSVYESMCSDPSGAALWSLLSYFISLLAPAGEITWL